MFRYNILISSFVLISLNLIVSSYATEINSDPSNKTGINDWNTNVKKFAIQESSEYDIENEAIKIQIENQCNDTTGNDIAYKKIENTIDKLPDCILDIVNKAEFNITYKSLTTKIIITVGEVCTDEQNIYYRKCFEEYENSILPCQKININNDTIIKTYDNFIKKISAFICEDAVIKIVTAVEKDLFTPQHKLYISNCGDKKLKKRVRDAMASVVSNNCEVMYDQYTCMVNAFNELGKPTESIEFLDLILNYYKTEPKCKT